MNWYGLDLRWAYVDLLPSICQSTHSTHTAYDILHDALVRFALVVKKDRIEQPHAYLRTIVRNLLVDGYREQARFLSLSELEPATDEACPAPGYEPALAPSPEHLADLQQRLQALERIIECLPPRCREVFWLFRIEGHTQPEIASKLGISLNMVERHIMRALVDLRAARELMGA